MWGRREAIDELLSVCVELRPEIIVPEGEQMELLPELVLDAGSPNPGGEILEDTTPPR